MKKIGILTFHDVINYGAVLQAYALQRYLQESGYYVQIINYRPSYFIRQYRYSMKLRGRSPLKCFRNLIYGIFWGFRTFLRQKKQFYDFRAKYLNISSEISSVKDLSSETFDAIIVGSDQIWNPAMTNNCFDPMFWGDFLPEIKKISYAASSGKYIFSQNEKEIIKKKLKNFFAISVREDQLAKFLLPLASGTPVQTVVDPTLLLPVRNWDELTIQRPMAKKYVVCYYVTYNKKIKKIARALAHRIGAVVIYFPSFDAPCVGKHTLKVGPDGFLSWMKYADFVVTNSFHGTVFSLIFNRDFLVIDDLQDFRIETLLKSVHLEERKVLSNITEFPKYNRINYALLNDQLVKISEAGKDFIQNSLKGV